VKPWNKCDANAAIIPLERYKPRNRSFPNF
jgi:hypothetical protein